MIEQTEISTAHQILGHRFSPSIALAEKLSELYVRPSLANDIPLESPRKLAVDLDGFRHSHYDTQIADAQKKFVEKPRQLTHGDLGVRSIGQAAIRPAALGIYFEVDSDILQTVTKDLFSMQSSRAQNNEVLQYQLEYVEQEIIKKPKDKILRAERAELRHSLESSIETRLIGQEVYNVPEGKPALLRLVVPERLLVGRQAVFKTLSTIAYDLKSSRKDTYSVIPRDIAGHSQHSNLSS